MVRLTILTEGEPPTVLNGLVLATDEDALQVGFAEMPSRGLIALDVTNSHFSAGGHTLEARRSEEDVLLFEEIATDPRTAMNRIS